jgi:hypothetical protein
LSDVRCPDARRAQIRGPNGISHRFQVSAYTGEPNASILARNLLSKRDWRSALGDKAVKDWPQVALVCCAEALPGCAEWLARARACPHGSILGPSGELEGEWPASDAGEEVALDESFEVGWLHVADAALVHNSIWQVAFGNKLAQPGGCALVKLVVVMHVTTPSHA